MLSNYMKEELPSILTPFEVETLRGGSLLCSTGFTFQRQGKQATAIVVDGLLHPKIYIGDDRGP